MVALSRITHFDERACRHLFVSTIPGAVMAPTGQFCIQAQQSPQRASTVVVSGIDAKGEYVEVTIIPAKTQREPFLSVISRLFFPMKPTPRIDARDFSGNLELQNILMSDFMIEVHAVSFFATLFSRRTLS